MSKEKVLSDHYFRGCKFKLKWLMCLSSAEGQRADGTMVDACA